jgi:putative NIF3 family GTP cyclohydrolase 1 type 2
MVSRKDKLAKLILSRAHEFDTRKEAWTEDILRYHNYVQLRTHFASGSLQICFDRKKEWVRPSEWAANHCLNLTRAFDEAAERLLFTKGNIQLVYILGVGSGLKKFSELVDSEEFLDLVLSSDTILRKVLEMKMGGQQVHEWIRGQLPKSNEV